MTASFPDNDAQLQELNRALAASDWRQAAALAFALAKRGALPVVELVGLAGQLDKAGQGGQAAELYHLWLRCTDSPLLYAVWYNLGVLQMQSASPQEAEQSLRAALTLKPDFLDARLALGDVQEKLGRPEAALATWQAALARLDPEQPASRPQQIRLLNHIGRVAASLHQHGVAEEACAHSLLLSPRQPGVAARWIEQRQQHCVWPVNAPLPGLDAAALADSASPEAGLRLHDNPAAQLATARQHAAALGARTPLSDQHGYVHRRLRIAYLAADFGSAPLAAEVYALHDRDVAEVYGFSWSNGEPDPRRGRVLQDLDHHIALDGMSDLQAAQTIRAHEIDILIDLCGWSADARPGIVAHKPAPVQIGWPAWPGSSGMPAIDHVLADAFVLPPDLLPHFSERPLYLPESCHLHDRRRAIAPAPTRAECGLPQQGFVFCCFHGEGRIAPAQFAGWMRILQRVPDSVLWLAAGHPAMSDNLRVEALRHGVASARLIFAPAATDAEQLARHQLADLALDTYPCGDAVRSADALWAGLPLLSRAGGSYAARQGGGLLHAAGLPELVTDSAQKYEDLAVRLATRPTTLARLRRRLARERLRLPLFDTPRQVRHLEQLYRQVARGALLAGAAQKTGAETEAAAGLPLVSLLIPASAADSNEALLRTVHSALAQDYGHCEIIVSDSGGASRPLARLLRRHPRLRYSRAPGLAAEAHLDHCLTLALGEYIAVAPAGDLLQPDNIQRMMHFYQHFPAVGLVACWRQPLAADGAPLPGLPLLPTETAVQGASLAAALLRSEGAAGALSQPAGMLLRRAGLGQSFGHYQGRRYHALGGLATALAALAGHACVYLPQALSSYQPALPAARPDATPQEAARLLLLPLLERLQLLLDSHTRQHFLPDPAPFKALLAASLTTLATLAAEHHPALAAGDKALGERVAQTLRDGYQLLLADSSTL